MLCLILSDLHKMYKNWIETPIKMSEEDEIWLQVTQEIRHSESWGEPQVRKCGCSCHDPESKRQLAVTR